MSLPQYYSVEWTVLLCLKRLRIPPEVGKIIFSFVYKRIFDNMSIRTAVKMLKENPTEALTLYMVVSPIGKSVELSTCQKCS
jgi:hypothetical protein